MSGSNSDLWERYKRYYRYFETLDLAIDISRMNFGDSFFEDHADMMRTAFAEMEGLEKGNVANPDENRRVGHYWLRDPELAPVPQDRAAIEGAIAKVGVFAERIHSGTITGQSGPFLNQLIIGIGGSALGPQFVSQALTRPGHDRLKPYFFDNTDPDGFDLVLSQIGDSLGSTLCIVISKSGGTKETRNGMSEAKAAYERAGLDFARHAVAITGEGSRLDGVARDEGWIERFPMWDWVGGRTSELSAVGLLPAALQGIEIAEMLDGARTCDAVTRERDPLGNPAALLALMWLHAGEGLGNKSMVILPYKDRLLLLSKYLQQLVMESLGKDRDFQGKPVEQGIIVFGNKGSTDQHAYIQQLRDGRNDFFANFIEVLRDRAGTDAGLMVDTDITSGDYLMGFLHGTRQALHENGRESITITLGEVSAFSVGVLIALYERAVGLYAYLININAYHQPGVEAGKKTAESILELQRRVLGCLHERAGEALTVKKISSLLPDASAEEMIFKICEHLARNPGRGLVRRAGKDAFSATYTWSAS